MTMSPTVVFPALHEVVIEDRAAPAPAAGEVQIRSRCTLISTGTELAMLQGKWVGRQFPHTPGYSNIGDVVGVGEGVDEEWKGRRVATYGAHTLYHCKDLSHVRPVPEPVPDEQAVFFTLAEIAMNGVRRGRVTWGESVVVYGAGLVGQLALRFARTAGARPVVMVDVADTRLQRLPHDTAVHAINSQREDVEEHLRQVTRGRMADAVFEVTGNAAYIPETFRPLRRQGRLVLLSSPRGDTTLDLHQLCNAPSYSIIGVHNGSHPPVATPDNPWTQHRHAELFFDLLMDGELEVGQLISHDESYNEAPRLYDMLVEDRAQAMGVVLRWS